MKVLHINNYDKGGGAETVFNITRNLKHKDIQNYSGFVPIKNHNDDVDINFSSWEDDGKFLGTINYIFSYSNYKLLYNYLLQNNIDIIHIHGFFSSLSPSILLAIKQIKQKKQLKVIQTLHDFHLICPNSSLFNFNTNSVCEKCVGKKFKYFILKDKCDRRGIVHSIIKGKRSFVSNILLNHKSVIDHFIVPSNFLKNKIIQDRIDPKRINLIRNSITLNSNQSNFKKENIICYFGRFSTEKNLEFLINAFTIWKSKNKNDFKLLLIGEGEKEQQLKNLSSTTNFSNDIIFKKFMPVDKLFKEIKSSKYFSLTSKCYENFPMSIIESIELNILPIVPNIGGMKESIQAFSNVGEVYQEGDIESWIDSINLLDQNYQENIKKLTENKEKILSELKSENYYSNILNLYNSITN